MYKKSGSYIAAGMFLAVSLCAIICMNVFSAKAAGNSFKGTGEGRNGPITVELTVINSKITAGKIISESETDFAKPAAKSIIDQAVAKGNTDSFDMVSGATLTSQGTIQAVKNAYAAAMGKATASDSYKDTECDVVIIGAGGAGMTAAIEVRLRSADAKIILLEKMGIVGGNTNSATGGLNASETAIQKELGIEDSNQQYFADTMKGGYNKNNPELVKKMTEESAAIVDWLISIGADLTDVGKMAGSTNKRTHRPKGGAPVGSHLTAVLKDNVEKADIDLRLNNKVTGIINDNGKAAGVTVEANGKSYKIKAKAVIITTGGFGANPEMLVKYNSALEGFGTTNHKGATGDAFAWGEQFNADVVDMTEIQTHPTVVPGNGVMITEAVRGNGAIIVNRDGKRFCSEMATRDVMSKAILEQKGKTAFLVFDQGVRESLKAIEGYVKQGLLIEAETEMALANKLAIPETDLVNTLEEYNRAQKAGEESMGRKASEMPRALENGPFYAVEIGPAVHHTMGGLKINTKAEVLDKNGNPIPGLFAAGEVTGGIHGGNRLGGNAVADIEIFGKIAGDSAMDYIK